MILLLLFICRAYNVNKLMPFQVRRVLDLIRETASDSLFQFSEEDMDKVVARGTCM